MFIFLLIFLLLFFLSVKKKQIFGLLLLVFWGVSSLLTINYGNIFTIYLLVCYLLISFLYLLFYAWFKKRQFSPYVEIDKDYFEQMQKKIMLRRKFALRSPAERDSILRKFAPGSAPTPVINAPKQPVAAVPSLAASKPPKKGKNARPLAIILAVLSVCLCLVMIFMAGKIQSLQDELRTEEWRKNDLQHRYLAADARAEEAEDLLEEIYPFLSISVNNLCFNNDESRYYHGYYCSELGEITGCAAIQDYKNRYHYSPCPVCAGYDTQMNEIMTEIENILGLNELLPPEISSTERERRN